MMVVVAESGFRRITMEDRLIPETLMGVQQFHRLQLPQGYQARCLWDSSTDSSLKFRVARLLVTLSRHFDQVFACGASSFQSKLIGSHQ